MKTALLVVSFGTTHPDILQKTIVQTENAIKNAFPNYPFYRAFISNFIIKTLKKQYHIAVDNVEEALSRIAADGYTHVLLQPTLLIPGEEMDRLQASVEASKVDLKACIGEPLLCNSTDMDQILFILEKTYPVNSETILLSMGHGTKHSGNVIYEQLAEKMRKNSGTIMRLCTIKGTPSFEDARKELLQMPQRKIVLVPLLFVAGEHIKNDMTACEEDSLCSILEKNGFCVDYKLQGLGEIPDVQQMFITKAKQIEKELY